MSGLPHEIKSAAVASCIEDPEKGQASGLPEAATVRARFEAQKHTTSNTERRLTGYEVP
jgi:hypothetical protein